MLVNIYHYNNNKYIPHIQLLYLLENNPFSELYRKLEVMQYN
jgi:hypothetical protein